MATVRKSKKNKIILAVIIVLVIAVIATVIGIAAKKSTVEQVSLYTVGTSDIYETVSATGEISSGSVKEYKVGTVATVKEVFVKTGDEVKEGDMLATFDTSNLDSEIKKLQSSYNQAKASYNDAVASQKVAKSNLAQVQKQIAALEKENAKLKNSVSNALSTTKRPQTTAALPSVPSIPNLPSDFTTDIAGEEDWGDDWNDEDITYPDDTTSDLVYAISDLTNAIYSLSDNIQINSAITNVVMGSVSNELQRGNTSSSSIADAAGNAFLEAVDKGVIDESQLIMGSDSAADMIERAVAAIDWKEIGESFANTSSVKLTTNQLLLTAYYAQEQLYSAMASDSLVYAKKEVMDTSKSALDVLRESQQEMSAGWTAAFDGTITECNIYPGEQTSLLANGITLQNMNNKIVTISLGEYDIHKVKVGMPVTVTTAYGKYTGSVISKAPVATGGSSSSIMDSVGSIAGISGLSSLTQSGAGVEVQVSVDNPDEFIIIGFDADVEIEVGDHIGIPTVPSQSIILDKTGTYVFLYNEEDKTVTKTLIETGATSVSEYEVVSGVKVGDRIVNAPQSTFEDSFEVRVAENTKS